MVLPPLRMRLAAHTSMGLALLLPLPCGWHRCRPHTQAIPVACPYAGFTWLGGTQPPPRDSDQSASPLTVTYGLWVYLHLEPRCSQHLKGPEDVSSLRASLLDDGVSGAVGLAATVLPGDVGLAAPVPKDTPHQARAP